MEQDKPTPLPWPAVIYGNDTGPDDGGFDEWWEIPGVAKFERQADAEFVRHLVNGLSGNNTERTMAILSMAREKRGS